MKLTFKIVSVYLICLIVPNLQASIDSSSQAPVDILSEEPIKGEMPKTLEKPAMISPSTIADKVPKTSIAIEEDIQEGLEKLPKNNELKKFKPKLKTILPFHSFCGTKLLIIPPNTQLVMEFAQKATIESFTYNHKEKKVQWFELEKCYTQMGWKSFVSAVSRSGNNQSILDEKLFVSAKLAGKPKLLAVNEIAPSWKIMVPVKVKYENETHYLMQDLKVKLVISIEKQHLGIDQIIATPTMDKHKYERNIDNIKRTQS